MRLLAVLIAMFVSTSALAQSGSSLLAPNANSLVLSNGWAVTPIDNGCWLTHTSDNIGSDLILRTVGNDQQIIVAVPLLGTTSSAASLAISMVARGDTARPLGQVVFSAVHGGPGTLLIARYLMNQLLPQLRSTDRLEFYGPDTRLIRSVKLNGIEQAVDSLQDCRRSSAPLASASPQVAKPAITSKWLNESDTAKCYLSRISDAGDEVRLTMVKRSPQVFLAIHLADPRGLQPGQVFEDTSITVNGSPPGQEQIVTDMEEIAKPVTRAVSGPDGLWLVATLDGSVLLKLRRPQWTELSIDATVWSTIVSTRGIAPAVLALVQCAQTRPG